MLTSRNLCQNQISCEFTAWDTAEPGGGRRAVMRQTGHRDPKMLEVYAREHAPLVANAVTRLGL
jgi:hypothetical protein